MLLRQPHEHMKMIGEDGIGQDLQTAVIGHQPQLLPEHLTIHWFEEPLPIHRTAHAMVHCFTLFRWHLDPSLSHARSLARFPSLPSLFCLSLKKSVSLKKSGAGCGSGQMPMWPNQEAPRKPMARE